MSTFLEDRTLVLSISNFFLRPLAGKCFYIYSKSVKKARILKVLPHIGVVISIGRRSCCSWTVRGATRRKKTQTKPFAFLGFYLYNYKLRIG